MLLTLGACGAPGDTGWEAEGGAAEGEAAAGPAEANGPAGANGSAGPNGPNGPTRATAPVTVTDHAGREVTIEGGVERIVSGYYITSSVCLALGLADRLVGIEARADARPIYALAKPDLLSLPSVGTARDFNLEACLELKPDLVLLPDRLRDAADTLDEMGVPVILVNPESYEALLDMISIIGKATGETGRAAQLTSWIEDSRKPVDELVSGLPDRPVVYMCGTASWLTTTPKDMFQASLIEMAGGRNAAGDIEGSGRIDISYEQLIVFDPDVIIVPPEAGFGIEDVLADPLLAELPAVRNGRVYQMPAAFEAWDSPVPSFMLGVKWLLSILHPDVYTTETLRRDAAGYYREFYGIGIDVGMIDTGKIDAGMIG